MTLIAALIFGAVAGIAVRGARRAATAAGIAWLVALALQTWYLGSGRGNQGTDTITAVDYWVVQVIALAVCLGIATLVSIRRARKEAARLVAPAGR